MKSLKATEMDYWREAMVVREIMGVKQAIVEEVRVKQLKWYGHVRRMTIERLPNQILDLIHAGRRKRERIRKSWRVNINREMHERGLEENQ